MIFFPRRKISSLDGSHGGRSGHSEGDSDFPADELIFIEAMKTAEMGEAVQETGAGTVAFREMSTATREWAV